MSALASLAESRIQDALEAGCDKELAGKGVAINLDADFAAPSELRAGFGLLKSAGVVPLEIEAMKEVQLLRQKLAACTNLSQQECLGRELRAREVELALGMERMKRSIKADVTG